MSRPIVQFIGTEETRTYGIGNAPVIEGVGAMQLRVQPALLQLYIRDRRLEMVSARGATVRHDGKPGAQRVVNWTLSEGWAGMPRWVVRIVRSAGVMWTEPRA